MVDKHHPVPAAALTLLLTLFAGGTHALDGLCRIPQQRIAKAMQVEGAKGYDLERTSNGVRLQAAVILDVVRERLRTDPDRRPFWLGHSDYFHAYLTVTGLAAEDAPTFARIGHEYGEDHVIDYRADRVVDEIRQGAQPDLAINVIAGWPAAPGAPEFYTYEDNESDPPLRVTHERTNSYRVLTFGDIIVYDDIDGIRGRATGGVLGLMFRVIGDGRAERSRMTVSSDGLQITRTTARKGPLRVTQTATVFPDGSAIRGIPDGRPDLDAIEDRLRAPLRIRYVDLGIDAAPAPPAHDCPAN